MSKKVLLEVDENEIRKTAKLWEDMDASEANSYAMSCIAWAQANPPKPTREKVLELPWSPGGFGGDRWTVVASTNCVYGWFPNKEQRDLALAAPKMAAAIAKYKHARAAVVPADIISARLKMWNALKESGWEGFDE